MVLDLVAQLDREFTERSKIEALLRELLDARRNRKSEQLSVDQLALFATAWQARQAEAEPTRPNDSDDDDPTRERIVHDLAEQEKHCSICKPDLRSIGEESSE